jgi:hypothetical protein
MFCTIVISTLSPLCRFLVYAQGCRPPISFWGRIRTLRLIVPHYDQIFVGPLCSILAGPCVLSLLWNTRIPREIAFSAGAGATVLFALVSPPRLKHWRLTGHHRLAPTFQEAQAAAVHKMGQP